MGITDHSIHPLERNGTTQRERLLKALIPGSLVLDDRNMADLLAFSGAYAKQIRFWDAGNQAAGDWACFWTADATSLLAMIAATDLDQYRIGYRHGELAFIRVCKAEKQAEEKTICGKASAHYLPYLTVKIHDLAVRIAGICDALPDSHPLKTETRSMIREKLGFNGQLNAGSPLETLIRYHKTANEVLKKNQKAAGDRKPDGMQEIQLPEPLAELIDGYGFCFADTSCGKAWELTVDDFNCIDFHPELTADDRDALWQLFLTFFKILTLIVTRAKKAFQQALNGRSDHPPHIALFLAFALLFRRYHQADMNAMADRHLVYYYRDVLRLQERGAIPDKVHIVFELAGNAEAYRLENNTLLSAGKDAKGLDLPYALSGEMVVNRASLVEKQSLYFLRSGEKVIPVALPAADRKDGLKIAYEKGSKAWHPLSGKSLFRKLAIRDRLLRMTAKRDERVEDEVRKAADNLEAIVANPGLIISTPELWLGKGGRRRIMITIHDCDDPDILSHFYTEISTGEGILRLHNRRSSNLRFDEKENSSEYRTSPNKPIEWQISMLESEASIAPLPGDTDPELGKQPFVRLRLIDGEDYEKVARTTYSGIQVQTFNSGLRDLTLQLGSTQYLPSSEIPLIGSTIAQEFSLYITSPEISLKSFSGADAFTLNGLENNERRHGPITFGAHDFLKKKKLDTPADAGDLFYSPTSKFSFLRTKITVPESNNERKPIIIYKLPGEDITLSYTSAGIELKPRGGRKSGLYHQDFFGGYAPVRDHAFLPGHPMPEPDPVISIDARRGGAASPAAQRADADGNLRLGLENLAPGQSVSMLFQCTEGTGNPDHIAPEEIVWSYLRSNEWVRIPATFILADETLGLRQTGIIRIQVPSDINNGNTLAVGQDGRTDLYWLMASAAEDPVRNVFVDALPMLTDIYVQAATAVFQNDSGNDLIHLEKGLPEESITQLRFRDPAISTVVQPQASFGGRFAESGDARSYYRRIHERLRHKQRAVTVWDYERLVLEQFPKIALAKCLPHTRDTNIRRPGYVTMGVIPYPGNMTGDRIYYPTFNAGDLKSYERYLNRHNSFFVSGQGGGVECCCAGGDGCGCHGDGTLLVRNAIFEPVRLRVCVRFRAGRDIAWYKKQLNEDLKAFLAPWAVDAERPITFGARVEAMELLRFLENLDYVDVIMELKFKHFPGRAVSEVAEAAIDFEEAGIIEPFTSRSVLTTYLDILNEDNPNVTDHDIQVVEDDACCAGCN